MTAKTKSTPDLGQEIVNASADAIFAMTEAGKDMFSNLFGSGSQKAAPPKRARSRKAAAKKPRTAARRRH